MTELITQLTPYALVGFGALAGIGGAQWHSRRNGNSGWDGKNERRIAAPTVTQRECELIHKGLTDRLDEGNRRMENIETMLQQHLFK